MKLVDIEVENKNKRNEEVMKKYTLEVDRKAHFEDDLPVHIVDML
jgi:hypothetical protein